MSILVDSNILVFSSQGLETESFLADLERIVTVLRDTPRVYAEWRRIVVEHEVRGVQVHDARIAAAMRAHGVERILTYNPGDFKRFAGIVAVRPGEVAG